MSSRATVEQTIEVEAPAAALWSYLTDWERHGDWIPLTRVETVGGAAHGVGGKLRAWSGIGPLGFWDPLTITEWEEHDDGGGRCVLVHTGRIVKGDAILTVTALSDARSQLSWVEFFDFGPLGRLGWRVAGGRLEQGLGRALRRMAAQVEGR